MIAREIELVNFRNYTKERVAFGEGVNVIYGGNAQGKTNLLEAVGCFCHGRSHRGSTDKELINFAADSARIRLRFDAYGRENISEVNLYKTRKKSISLNGIPLKRTSELLSNFKGVLFSPEELDLIKDGPDKRRKFLDMFLSSFRPSYYSLLQCYMKALRQKNNLLRNIAPQSVGTLAVWNERLVEFGSKIVKFRQNFASLLGMYAKGIYKDISSGKEELEIFYKPSVRNEDEFRTRLSELREAELSSGISLCGPHRDDLCFEINGKSAKLFGSQGQQRSVVLCLKLAQMEIIYNDLGEYPVLLLDDILSELDSERRSFLTEKIRGKQVIMTCTDRVGIGGDVSYFRVESGKVFA